ncbi:MAG: sortase B protein-sorting domain-containing protein [Emergencia timonensis]|uniref:Sortase B protein-sorting domain-containing protein n=1 Tax=Emergencia timonensis TaxID=1776384 RepID=A0A415DZF5_9FIRM|nr:sortase B protein-sorting domain-containing protein [Clostridiales bacterium]MCB6474636.1 sortase B protein-sorting domain-containing protein [Emergencia timonensis]RHJ86204.1 sortase B protein-sorting domain-containing protein [Emergencia timonensis]
MRKSSKTGDESRFLLYILLAGVACGTMTAVVRRKKTSGRQ